MCKSNIEPNIGFIPASTICVKPCLYFLLIISDNTWGINLCNEFISHFSVVAYLSVLSVFKSQKCWRDGRLVTSWLIYCKRHPPAVCFNIIIGSYFVLAGNCYVAFSLSSCICNSLGFPKSQDKFGKFWDWVKFRDQDQSLDLVWICRWHKGSGDIAREGR